MREQNDVMVDERANTLLTGLTRTNDSSTLRTMLSWCNPNGALSLATSFHVKITVYKSSHNVEALRIATVCPINGVVLVLRLCM